MKACHKVTNAIKTENKEGKSQNTVSNWTESKVYSGFSYLTVIKANRLSCWKHPQTGEGKVPSCDF